MDDLRELLTAENARTSPTQLIWTVRSLCEGLQHTLLDGPDEDPARLDRDYARMTAMADAALLYANALASWLDRHEAECDGTD